MAHKKAGAETIRISVTETKSDAEFLELAIERNAKHGLQLSIEDKKNCAIRIYLETPISERRGKRERLAQILGVSQAKLSEMLSRTDKEERDKRDRRVRDAWMACYTQDEIAEREGISKAAVNEVCLEFSDVKNLNKSNLARAEHADEDFAVPLYNVWKQQEKSSGSQHFGNSDPRWVDNLLYLYTQPFDVVVDPFAGAGLVEKSMGLSWLSLT
jgi:transcriptional regulator with XRE-family HTH domain